ncbi:hypothetical protein [Clostridium tarantellae]|uniref:Nucleoside phosphorylase domain-containing protein n=1 Tax=Clostridium tarantellae TaxID=39493 RepID=A0A6I1MLH6_9CLOT|nr:hypothetical protein [Clostridium tarantellae]MPQ43082.1 hypothetical protein [Clostridium tarantellae]
MIFISVAMYCEAYPFIKKLKLKKDMTHKKFEVFKNDEIKLIIIGTGKIKAAIGTTYLFSNMDVKKEDIFINLGVCGAANEKISKGTVCMCNKLVENETKKTFYPDILIKHPFKEYSIETFSFVVNKNILKTEEDLVDMEAVGVYEASLLFFKTHQIYFIKVVSDNLKDTHILNKEKISLLIEYKLEEIFNWINEVKAVFSFEKDILTKKDKEIISKVSMNLKLSATMENVLKQLCVYYKLRYEDFTHHLNTYLKVECVSKNEGKKYFEVLKQELI